MAKRCPRPRLVGTAVSRNAFKHGLTSGYAVVNGID
jgi:hypothetical protein